MDTFLAALLSAVALVQPRPNFSGTWDQLHLTKCWGVDYTVVEQTASRLLTRSWRSAELRSSYRLDGTPETTTRGGHSETTTATWQGARLKVVTETREANRNPRVRTEVWQIGAGGRLMIDMPATPVVANGVIRSVDHTSVYVRVNPTRP